MRDETIGLPHLGRELTRDLWVAGMQIVPVCCKFLAFTTTKLLMAFVQKVLTIGIRCCTYGTHRWSLVSRVLRHRCDLSECARATASIRTFSADTRGDSTLRTYLVVSWRCIFNDFLLSLSGLFTHVKKIEPSSEAETLHEDIFSVRWSNAQEKIILNL